MNSPLKKLWRALYALPVTLAACQTTAASEPVPAVLKTADASSVRVLKTTLAKAMNERSVQFGVIDLENSSKISAFPTRYAPPPGAPLNYAQNFAIPTSFTLMMDGNACYLLKYGSDEKIPLTGIACRPLGVRN